MSLPDRYRALLAIPPDEPDEIDRLSAPSMPPLLRFKDVMADLRISRSTVYRLMERGVLHGYKVGSGWRFFEEDVQACIKPGKGQ